MWLFLVKYKYINSLFTHKNNTEHVTFYGITINQTTALQKIYYICSSETAVSELGMKGMSL
mgnify:CR=1 FL=1